MTMDVLFLCLRLQSKVGYAMLTVKKTVRVTVNQITLMKLSHL